MECKKCGAIIPEDGIFCVSCGARADGKKNCPKCEKLIDDTVTFCTYCGTRVDGKKICATCGELVEGKFCAKCGSIVEEIAITKPSIKKSSSTKSGAVLSVIERIANPIIYIVALVLLLVCSFFIGTNVVTNVNETLITKNYDVFYYFGQGFKDTEQLISSISNIARANYEFGVITLNVSNVVCLVVIIANFIIQAIVAPLGITEGIKALCKKQSSKGYKYATISFVSFIFTTFVLAQDVFTKGYIEVYYNSITTYFNTYNSTISGASVAGIVVGAILLLISIVLTQLKKGKEFYTAKNLKKFIPAIFGCVFMFIAAISKSAYISIVGNEGNELINIVFSSSVLLKAIVPIVVDSTIANTLEIVVFLTIASYIITSILIGLFAYSLKFFFNGIYNEECKGKGALILSIISSILALVNMIITIIFVSSVTSLLSENGASLDAIKFATGSGSIIWLVMSVLALTSAITYTALNSNKETY